MVSFHLRSECAAHLTRVADVPSLQCPGGLGMSWESHCFQPGCYRPAIPARTTNYKEEAEGRAISFEGGQLPACS